MEKFFTINQKRIYGTEGVFYEWRDVLCLVMDMMGVDRPYFLLSDLLTRYYYAPHFINIFTSCPKFKAFIERDTFITPVTQPFTDFFKFYKEQHERITNFGNNGDEEVILKDRGIDENR